MLICLAVDLGDAPWCDTADSDIALKDVMDAQGYIGWSLLQYGFVAKAWKNTQVNWARTRDPKYLTKRGNRWARQLQESLWDYVAAIWDHRKKTVHGIDKIDHEEKAATTVPGVQTSFARCARTWS